VAFAPMAEQQCEWLESAHGVILRDVAERVLGRDPAPHRAAHEHHA